jgi:hypothetical protein
MSMESKSYRRMPKSPHFVFWIELRGDRDEFRFLSKSLEEAEIHFDGKLAYPSMAMALPPYTIFFSIIAAAGSLATIANILHKHLTRKKEESGKKITFKFNGKEMTIEGNYSKEEILKIVQEYSRVARAKEISAISKKRKKKFKAELKELKTNLQVYKKLVEIGESQKKPNREWKSKLKQYRTKKAEIESKISFIQELLEE